MGKEVGVRRRSGNDATLVELILRAGMRKRKLEAEAEEAPNFSGSGSGSGSNNKEVLPLPIIGFTLYFFTLILAAINRRNFNRNL